MTVSAPYGAPRSVVTASPSIDKLADWETRTFPVLRRQRDAATPTHNAVPNDEQLDPDALRAALATCVGASNSTWAAG